jgi:hypothetical protein
MLGRNIARLENCTGLHDTGVLEDEGRFLQNVYPTEDMCGGPGRFGFDPRAHLTETSALLTRGNVAKLRASWHAHWDNSKAIFVEKTPANLLMTRFLQAAFPNSYFVVIKRHPVAVAMAAQKWKLNVTPLYNMFEHWLHCHALYEQDKKYLKHVYELSYEDYIENADKYHRQIAEFIGTRVPEPPEQDTFRYVAQWRSSGGLRVPERTMEEPTRSHNQKYFNRWSDFLNNSPLRCYYQYIAVQYEPKFMRYGYSLINEFGLTEERRRAAERIPTTTGKLYCVVANIHALIVRVPPQARSNTKRLLRAHLPEPLKARIKNLVRKFSPMKKQSKMVSC